MRHDTGASRAQRASELQPRTQSVGECELSAQCGRAGALPAAGSWDASAGIQGCSVGWADGHRPRGSRAAPVRPPGVRPRGPGCALGVSVSPRASPAPPPGPSRPAPSRGRVPGGRHGANSCGARRGQECAARREIAKVLGPGPSPAVFPAAPAPQLAPQLIHSPGASSRAVHTRRPGPSIPRAASVPPGLGPRVSTPAARGAMRGLAPGPEQPVHPAGLPAPSPAPRAPAAAPPCARFQLSSILRAPAWALLPRTLPRPRWRRGAGSLQEPLARGPTLYPPLGPLWVTARPPPGSAQTWEGSGAARTEAGTRERSSEASGVLDLSLTRAVSNPRGLPLPGTRWGSSAGSR